MCKISCVAKYAFAEFTLALVLFIKSTGCVRLQSLLYAMPLFQVPYGTCKHIMNPDLQKLGLRT